MYQERLPEAFEFGELLGGVEGGGSFGGCGRAQGAGSSDETVPLWRWRLLARLVRWGGGGASYKIHWEAGVCVVRRSRCWRGAGGVEALLSAYGVSRLEMSGCCREARGALTQRSVVERMTKFISPVPAGET